MKKKRYGKKIFIVIPRDKAIKILNEELFDIYFLFDDGPEKCKDSLEVYNALPQFEVGIKI